MKGILETCRLTLDTTAYDDDVHLTVTTRVLSCSESFMSSLWHNAAAAAEHRLCFLYFPFHCTAHINVCALLFSSTELIAQKRAELMNTLPLLTANLFAVVRRACRDDDVDHNDHFYSFTSLSHSIPVSVFWPEWTEREEVNNWKRRSRLISLSGHSLLLLLNGLILLPRIMGRSLLLRTWSTEAFQTVSADDEVEAEVCWPPFTFSFFLFDDHCGGSFAVACVSFQASKSTFSLMTSTTFLLFLLLLAN